MDPKFQGRLVSKVVDSEQRSTMAVMYAHPDIGPDWLRRLFSAEMNVTFHSDFRIMVDQFVLGRFALCLCSGATDDLEKLRAQGAPIEEVKFHEEWKDRPVLELGGSRAIISRADNAANSNAQKVFFNWFLSREGQTALHALPEGSPPAPTLRNDVTEVGRTRPEEWRQPGRDYVLVELADNTEQLQSEAAKLIDRLLEEHMAR